MTHTSPTADARQHQLVRVEMSERVTYVKHYTHAELADTFQIPIGEVPALIAGWLEHGTPFDPEDPDETSQAVLDVLDTDECWSGGEDRSWRIETTP